MTKDIAKLNELLVSIYNSIDKYERAAMRRGPFPDLSVTEAHTLVEIGERAKSMGEVAANLGITIATLSVSIKRLCNRGYVKREMDKDDRRIVLISLTKKGLKAKRIHLYFHSVLMKNTIGKLKEKEQDVLTCALKRIKDFFYEYASVYEEQKYLSSIEPTGHDKGQRA